MYKFICLICTTLLINAYQIMEYNGLYSLYNVKCRYIPNCSVNCYSFKQLQFHFSCIKHTLIYVFISLPQPGTSFTLHETYLLEGFTIILQVTLSVGFGKLACVHIISLCLLKWLVRALR